MATLITCGNCHHNRSSHKKIDGNAWCAVTFCACKNFVEREIPFDRRKVHDSLDEWWDTTFKLNPDPPTEPEE